MLYPLFLNVEIGRKVEFVVGFFYLGISKYRLCPIIVIELQANFGPKPGYFPEYPMTVSK